jgi:hypothetical protein
MQLDSLDEPKSSDNRHRPIGLQTGDVSEVDLMSFEARTDNSLWTLKSSNLTLENSTVEVSKCAAVRYMFGDHIRTGVCLSSTHLQF